MIFSILFVFCTCKAHKLAENQTNLAENQKKKKTGSAEPMEPAFCKSVYMSTATTLTHGSLKVHAGVPILLCIFFSGAQDQLPGHYRMIDSPLPKY